MKENLREKQTDQRELVHRLHHIQETHGYIPPESITELSKELKISESEIFGVLTFYKAFSLTPRGENVVTVCMGTACHVRGGPQILEDMERKLDVRVGDTTPDEKFTLEKVNCIGCCAIGPVVEINGKYFSNVSVKKVDSILKEYKED
jgi:NADH-quinone oxidoreductase subunit E